LRDLPALFDRIGKQVIGEDPLTEYLILLGMEHPPGKRELQWHGFNFSAGEGPAIQQGFRLLTELL
jgi:hypothetical protein